MALNPITLKPKSEEGGGLFGKVLGGVAGGIIGTFAGNPVMGASIGSALGGAAGEAIKPGEVSSSGGVALSKMANDPKVQMLQLSEAEDLVRKDPRIDPIDANTTIDYFNNAREVLKKRLGYGA